MVVKARRKKTSSVGLEHTIPDMKFYDEYVQRDFEGRSDIDILRYAMETQQNVMMFGPTGPGKTSLMLAYAAVEQLPLVVIQANGAMDPNTFYGGWQPTPTEEEPHKIGWVSSEVADVIENGGVLYINEVNYLHPKTAATFHGLTDKRRQAVILEKNNEVINANDRLLIVVDYNPDYEGTRPMSAAFKNRFKIKLRFDYDDKVESALVYTPVVLEVARKLRESHASGVINTPISTNLLVEFEELAVDLGYEFALWNFLNAFPDDERRSVEETMTLHNSELREQVQQMIDIAENESSEES